VKTPISATGISINSGRCPPYRAARSRSGADARGFTLLEILVVILIIGIALGTVMLSLRPNTERQLDTEAQRFGALVSLLSSEAIIRAAEMAIEITPDSYRFLILGDDGWQELEDDTFKPRQLPETMRIDLHLDGETFDFRAAADSEQNPRIFVLSSGELTPFEVTFHSDDSDTTFSVSGDITGALAYAR
jgi:general secretion pathway protein H